MTADLRLVEADAKPGPPGSADLGPVGAHMAEISLLWGELVAAGPPLTSCYGVVLGSYVDGRIEASFNEYLPFLAWAEYLGIAFSGGEKFGGSSLVLHASGPVQRGNRGAHIHLRCATTERGLA